MYMNITYYNILFDKFSLTRGSTVDLPALRLSAAPARLGEAAPVLVSHHHVAVLTLEAHHHNSGLNLVLRDILRE